MKTMALVLVLLTAVAGVGHRVAMHAELRQQRRPRLMEMLERYQHELRQQCSLRTDARAP